MIRNSSWNVRNNYILEIVKQENMSITDEMIRNNIDQY